MKKYNVHIILGDKFHSVVVEADGFIAEKGYYGFYKDKEALKQMFAWYPIPLTVVEPYIKTMPPSGSGSLR